MKQSHLFTKTKKEAPTDEVSKNAEFLVRGGYIHKEMAGVYSYLPLGLRVLKKIENIIREKMKDVYKTIFTRTGIGHITYLTFASGGTFSKYSHEFQTLAPTGEDTIYVDEASNIALNKEVLTDEVLAQLHFKKEKLVEKRAIEVGNIFDLKTKYSKPFDRSFTDQKGAKHVVLMGCYGIGLGRLMGALVEALADEQGIIWPDSIAPFAVHLLALGEEAEIAKEADKIYETL